jgi:hypothetical protein
MMYEALAFGGLILLLLVVIFWQKRRPADEDEDEEDEAKPPANRGGYRPAFAEGPASAEGPALGGPSGGPRSAFADEMVALPNDDPTFDPAIDLLWDDYLVGESGAHPASARVTASLIEPSGPNKNHEGPDAAGYSAGATAPFHMARGSRRSSRPPISRVNQTDMGVVSGFAGP